MYIYMGFRGLAARRDRIKKGLSESNSTVNLTPQSVPELQRCKHLITKTKLTTSHIVDNCMLVYL